LSWQTIIKNTWMGYCNACKKWQNEQRSYKNGDKYYCGTRINYYGENGQSQRSLREGLENYNGLHWDRNKDAGVSKCGMELTEGKI